MKVKFIYEVLQNEIENIKNSKQPNVFFIINAYKNLVKKIHDAYPDENINLTKSKIELLEITPHMKEKLKFLITTKPPKLKKNSLVNKLDKVLGIGEKKANDLINKGLKNFNQLKSEKWFNMLSKESQLTLMHSPLKKIPHGDITKIMSNITSYKKAYLTLAGSYRRNKPFSKDIDVIIVTNDKELLDDYIQYLNKQFDSHVFVYSKGSDKLSLIIKPFKNKNVKYKLDIFRTNKENYYPMLLYLTGSKEFNVKMRRKAKQLGMLLNQTGLYNIKNGKKINKPNDTEEKIFSYLNMSYINPEDR